jgi:uncharacterized alkaline shock family protein YloU
VAPRTSNLYGKIIISKKAIKQIVIATARETYGVACVGKTRYLEYAAASVSCKNNRISVSIMLYLKFGITIDPVLENIRRAIKYNVESFTGMTVDCVNIDVLGILN